MNQRANQLLGTITLIDLAPACTKPAVRSSQPDVLSRYGTITLPCVGQRRVQRNHYRGLSRLEHTTAIGATASQRLQHRPVCHYIELPWVGTFTGGGHQCTTQYIIYFITLYRLGRVLAYRTANTTQGLKIFHTLYSILFIPYFYGPPPLEGLGEVCLLEGVGGVSLYSYQARKDTTFPVYTQPPHIFSLTLNNPPLSTSLNPQPPINSSTHKLINYYPLSTKNSCADLEQEISRS